MSFHANILPRITASPRRLISGEILSQKAPGITRFLIVSLLFLSLLVSCASYRPRSLPSAAMQQIPAIPDSQAVVVQARAIQHPLLKPVPFDLKDGLSPDEAAILAVIINPALRAVRDQRGIASAQLLQAGILPNPRLAYDLEIPVGGATQGKLNAFGFGLGWDVTSLISRNARLDAARAHASSIDLDVAWHEWQVAEAARLHTYHLIFAGQRLTVAKKAEISFQRLWKDIKRGVALGVKTQLDLSATETSLQEAKLQVLVAQSAVNEEKLALNRALGLPPGRVILLEKTIFPALNQCPSRQVLLKNAETRRLDLLALRLGYDSQEARVRAAVRSRFPEISLGLTGGRDPDDLQTGGLGLSIELPFFNRNQGHIARERATRKQLFDKYTARLFETRADIARLVTAVVATRRQIAGGEGS